MQSSQVRNVGLPSSAEAKRDVPAWTQDPKIFPLDWFSVSRPNIIRQTKEYVSELSKWRNCPEIKTLSKLKAVLKRIMMFLHTHTSYIDGKSLLECDLEEDLITLVSLYMHMELRVLLIKKSAASGVMTTTGQRLGNTSGLEPDMDTGRNDKLVANRISYWLYTVLTGHEQRVDALLSVTIYTRHTRPVLDPIFRKILSEMSDGPFSSVNYVRHMLAYKTWRERALLVDDTTSEELNTRVLHQLVPRDYAFPQPLLRCLGKGDSARDHVRPHNVNLADACRNFMRFCREMPAAVADQINFGSIPLFDDDMLGDEENEVNKLINMISDRKQRKVASLSPRSNSYQVDAFIDLTLPKSRMKSTSSRGVPSIAVADIIDLTEEDEKPVMSSRTSPALDPPVAAQSRTASTAQRISASKKAQPPQDCSHALAPSAAQVETRCFTAFREQDIYLVNISCMCPVRAHRQRECQCQDKKVGYHKDNKALKTSKTERKYENDATFVGRCFQFSIGGNQYAYPSEDDVDTEIQPLVVGNSQDQVKLEMRTPATVTCNTNENETRDEATGFCDKLYSARLNLCDCEGCKRRDSNLSRYENRTCTSAETRGESANEHSDISVQCNKKPIVTCTQQVSHPASVADMYAMKKTSPIVLQSQQSTSLSQKESQLEHFSETLDKRKVQLNENIAQNNETPEDKFIRSERNLSNNLKDEIRQIKLPVVEPEIVVNIDNDVPTVSNEIVISTNIIAPTNTFEEIVSLQKSENKFTESTNITATVTFNENIESEEESVVTESTNVTITTTVHDRSTSEVPTSEKISLVNTQNENSNNEAEIEKLCTEISELGCSITQSTVPNFNNVVEKNELISANAELLPIKHSEHKSEFKILPTCYEFVPDITAANIAENNSEMFSARLEPILEVSTHRVDMPDQENTQVSDNPLWSVQTDLSVVQLEENVIIEEKIDSNEITKDTADDEITNEVKLIENSKEKSIKEHTYSTNSVQNEFVEELASELETIIESKVVVESISNENQLEHSINSTITLPSIELDTVRQEDLNTIPIETDVQDSSVNNMRKRRMSLVANTKKKEFLVDSKDSADIVRHLPPRKRRRRKTDDTIINKYKYDQQNIDVLHKENYPEMNGIYDVLEKPKRRESWPSDAEILREPELITTKSEPVDENIISDVSKKKFLNINHDILTEKISIDKTKPGSEEIYQRETCEKNISNEHNVEEETPKRRRKQNLKNIIKEDKSTSPVNTFKEIAKEDQCTSFTQKKDKELFIVCKKLTQSEIEHLRTIKVQSPSDNHLNIIPVKENSNKRTKSRNHEDSSNNVIKDTTPQLTKLTENEGEQTKLQLNFEKKDTSHDNNSEITLKKNSEVKPQIDNTSTEKEKQIKIKGKSRSQSNVNKIINKATKPRKVKSSQKSMKITPNSKFRRSIGRPSKMVSNKLKFFSDNFNLHNLDFKTSKSNNFIEEIHVSSIEKVNTSLDYELSEEDIPLAYRMSQSHKKNSCKFSNLEPLSNVESKLINSEEDLTLTSRKHKLKVPQSSKMAKNYEPVTKPKSFHNKLKDFKSENVTLQEGEAETLSLKKPNKCLKTYSNTKPLKAQEIFSVPDLFQTVIQKIAKSNESSKVTILERKNFDETLEDNYSNISEITNSELEDQQSISTEVNFEGIKSINISLPCAEPITTEEFRETTHEASLLINPTKIASVHNDSIESSTTKDEHIASIMQIIKETENKSETKTLISKSGNVSVLNKDADILRENMSTSESPIEKSEFIKGITNDTQINMKIEIEENKDTYNDLNQLTTNVTSGFNNEITEVNTDSYTKPVNIDSYLTFVPKKMLSKKAREKLFAADMNTLENNLNEKLDVVKETDEKGKDTPESKNILNHDKTAENVLPENDELQKHPKLLSGNATIETSILYQDNDDIQIKNPSRLITCSEQEISTKKQEETSVEFKKTEENTYSDEITTIPSKELYSNFQYDLSMNAVDKNVKIIKFPMNDNYTHENSEITSEEKSGDAIHSVHRPLNKRKSKFPKLKFKMNSKSNVLSRKLHNNIKSLPKAKTRINNKKKNNTQLKKSNDNIKDTLLSVTRKTKKTTSGKTSLKGKKSCKKIDLGVKNNASHRLKFVPTTNSILNIVKDDTKSFEPNIQISIDISNENATLNPGSTTKSMEFTEISVKKLQDNKLDYISSVVDINNQIISEDIIENVASARIDKKTGDMLYKPSNKIYEKHFDFYSDQDDASNSELVIDTSAESSDAESTATCDKIKAINHQIIVEVAVSEPKYHHSIAEIVNMKEKTIPNEDKCSVVDTDIRNSSEHKVKINSSENFEVSTINSSTIQTVKHRKNTSEHQKNNIIDISNQVFDEINTFKKTTEENIFKGTTAEHQEGIFDKVSDSSLILTVDEKFVKDISVINISEKIQHSNEMADDLNVDIVSREQRVVEQAKEENNLIANKTVILEETTEENVCTDSTAELQKGHMFDKVSDSSLIQTVDEMFVKDSSVVNSREEIQDSNVTADDLQVDIKDIRVDSVVEQIKEVNNVIENKTIIFEEYTTEDQKEVMIDTLYNSSLIHNADDMVLKDNNVVNITEEIQYSNEMADDSKVGIKHTRAQSVVGQAKAVNNSVENKTIILEERSTEDTLSRGCTTEQQKGDMFEKVSDSSLTHTVNETFVKDISTVNIEEIQHSNEISNDLTVDINDITEEVQHSNEMADDLKVDIKDTRAQSVVGQAKTVNNSIENKTIILEECSTEDTLSRDCTTEQQKGDMFEKVSDSSLTHTVNETFAKDVSTVNIIEEIQHNEMANDLTVDINDITEEVQHSNEMADDLKVDIKDTRAQSVVGQAKTVNNSIENKTIILEECSTEDTLSRDCTTEQQKGDMFEKVSDSSLTHTVNKTFAKDVSTVNIIEEIQHNEMANDLTVDIKNITEEMQDSNEIADHLKVGIKDTRAQSVVGQAKAVNNPIENKAIILEERSTEDTLSRGCTTEQQKGDMFEKVSDSSLTHTVNETFAKDINTVNIIEEIQHNEMANDLTVAIKDITEEMQDSNEIADYLNVGIKDTRAQSVVGQAKTVNNPIENKAIILEERSTEDTLSRGCTTEQQKGDIFEKVSDSSLTHTVNETFAKDISTVNIIEEIHNEIANDLTVDIKDITEEMQHSNEIADHLKVDIVSVNNIIDQSVVEEVNNPIENKSNILEEHTAVITEISEEICDELHIETLLEEEYAKEGCVKCSVNGKHKDNKKVLVWGNHQYQQNNVEECLEENGNIPAIPYYQESLEQNSCTLIAKSESVKILVDNSPVPDNYNLCILADLAMNSVHLNTKTENNNVIEITAENLNTIQNQRPLQKDERCFLVSFPEKLPTSNKPTTSISIINRNHEEVSVNIQKLAAGLNPKGILLENKIQALTERARTGTRTNGENLDELYKSLENICEIEINTLTRTSPKCDGHGQHNILPVPNDISLVNSKFPEPNITIDIPNTAHLHLTPDDDDFMMRNEPFILQQQSTTPQSSISDKLPESIAATKNEADLDSTGVKNLYNVIDSITLTNNQKEINSENENVDSNAANKAEQETKTKSKKGRSKSKSSNNQVSETSYWLNKYKSNHDSNKQIEINNQQNLNNNKNISTSPQSYIRSTRPMRMVTTRKRNVNVLDNKCSPDEPAKKISASEKMFDKLLEDHKKELTEAKFKDETKENIVVDLVAEIRKDESKKEISSFQNICGVKDATMPVLEDCVPETNIISTPTTTAEELNIPLPVLQYKISESDIKNDTIISQTDPLKLDKSNVTVKKLKSDISINKCENARIENTRIEKICEETEQVTLSEDSLVKTVVNTEMQKQIELTEEYSLNQEETTNTNTNTQTRSHENTEGQIIEEQAQNTVDRNASAIEVVQDWFNRVDDNKTQTESYTEIASDHTIEECNFFEEISSTSENSPNARKSDEKIFSEHHQTPDSGIAFDEDSVQKDKSVDSQTPIPENLSDGEIYCHNEPMIKKSYFCNLGDSAASETIQQEVQITDIKMTKSVRSREINKILKVSIALERIKDLLPLLTKQKVTSPERKLKKRKECGTDSEKGKKRKHSMEETCLTPITEHDGSKALLKDCKIKRIKHSADNIVPECMVEEVVSSIPNQKNVSSIVRTKGSVKEYPDCLFGITESPVPSGSFNSPYPSDISLTEEPTFYEEEGIDLCNNDYPCYDSFEVLQEQQSLQKEYNVVDDNPKDMQQGLQAGYCVVDSQFFPLSEYLNDDYNIMIDNKIFNDKRMVPVNMHEVQPEAKPHNTEEVKRSEFDDSEKEDSLSETVDEIIKNPNLFSEQSTSEVQVISMDQATSEVQVVIACDTYQETEMPDTYLFGIALSSELASCDNISIATVSEIQNTSMDLEEAASKSKVTDKSVDFNPATPVMGSENEQFYNTRVVPVADVPQPVSMELLTVVDSISEPAINLEELPEQKTQEKNLTDISNKDKTKIKTSLVHPEEEKNEEKSNQLYSKKLSLAESDQLTASALKTPLYSTSTKNSKILNPDSSAKIQPSSPVQSSSRILDKNISASKDLKKSDCHQGTKIPNRKSPYPDHRSLNSVQKPSDKSYNSNIPLQCLTPLSNKKPTDPKTYPKPHCPKTYSSIVPKDAFDKLKEERTDITPPDSRKRYHSSSSSDPNFVKNRCRKDTPPADYHRKYPSDRDSSRLRHSDVRRPQSACTESSSKHAYRLPPSDSTYRSPQYNKKPDLKPSHPKNRPEQNKHSPSSSSAHDDWLKNETILQIIKSKAANAIYNKKY